MEQDRGVVQGRFGGTVSGNTLRILADPREC